MFGVKVFVKDNEGGLTTDPHFATRYGMGFTRWNIDIWQSSIQYPYCCHQGYHCWGGFTSVDRVERTYRMEYRHKCVIGIVEGRGDRSTKQGKHAFESMRLVKEFGPLNEETIYKAQKEVRRLNKKQKTPSNQQT